MIVINNTEYILSEEFFKNAPMYCKHSRNGRELIKNKLIENTNYVYGMKNENNWIMTNGNSKKYDKLLFKKTFVDSIIPNNINIIINDEIAPEILELEENEKFKDENGNAVNIETRGEKSFNKMFFKLKDIIEIFQMNNLKNMLICGNKYVENKDYKYFIIDNATLKKELFLTFEGFLRVLFSSRSQKIRKILDWIIKTLFTMQMGTKTQKQELVSNILDVDAEVIEEVLNTNSNTVPSMYLFTLGFVKDLRKSMNINNEHSDDSMVAKFGFTKDFTQLNIELKNIYEKIDGCDFKLKYHSYIDLQFMTKAKSDLMIFTNALDIKYEFDDHEGLIIIPDNLINFVEKQYKYIGEWYVGHLKEVLTKISDLENNSEMFSFKNDMEFIRLKHNGDVQQIQHDREILKLKHDGDVQKILYDREIQKLKNECKLQEIKYENLLLRTEIEIMKLKK